MRELRARTSSGLLQLSAGTRLALGTDESTHGAPLLGQFAKDVGVSWLARGAVLEVLSPRSGQRLSAYCFSGPSGELAVSTVKGLTWAGGRYLLVGLENAQRHEGVAGIGGEESDCSGIVCLYDLGTSRVTRAIEVPGRVKALEVVSSSGGADASTQHLHQDLRWLFGIVAVATHTGHVLLLDLCLDDMSDGSSEGDPMGLEAVYVSATGLPGKRESAGREGRHIGLQLCGPAASAARGEARVGSALLYVQRTNQLVAGFSDGNMQIWNLATLKRVYHTQVDGGTIPVSAFAFQEPENDPRNCCYLWAAQSLPDVDGEVVSLHLFQMLFQSRKCVLGGKVIYQGLKYCEECYSQELTDQLYPAQGSPAGSTLLGCQVVERYRHREDTILDEGAFSPDISVAVFVWEAHSFRATQPLVYLGIFDINRWYHAQMPNSIRLEDSMQGCNYFSLWSLEALRDVAGPSAYVLHMLALERSFSQGVPTIHPPPEQFYSSTSYTFDVTCLMNNGVVNVTCPGLQTETLSHLSRALLLTAEGLQESYSRCRVAGLLPSRLANTTANNLSWEEKMEAVLSVALKKGILGMITSSIRAWASAGQVESTSNLRFLLDWTWNKVVSTKEKLDQLCLPLFDGSCNALDHQRMQALHGCQLVLLRLSSLLGCFLSEAPALLPCGVEDVAGKQKVVGLMAQYAQVVFWFCHAGLLPESPDEEEDDAVGRKVVYRWMTLQHYYSMRRQHLARLAGDRWNADCLLIDGFVAEIGEKLQRLWRRDEGGTGQYPPRSLHALLDIYLLEDFDFHTKNTIVTYLLLDVQHSGQERSGPTLESFPASMGLPLDRLRLVHAYWLLDHKDFQAGLDALSHPGCRNPLKPWQHERALNALLSQREVSLALRYLYQLQPPVSGTTDVLLHITILLANRCVLEAWNLLQRHVHRDSAGELLQHFFSTCLEGGLMDQVLRLPFSPAEQEVLEHFLDSSEHPLGKELLLVHHLEHANYLAALRLGHGMPGVQPGERDPRVRERVAVRQLMLEQCSKILPRVTRRLAFSERPRPYHLLQHSTRGEDVPKPLSTVVHRAGGQVMSRATFLGALLRKMREVHTTGGDAEGDAGGSTPTRETEGGGVESNGLDVFLDTPIQRKSTMEARLQRTIVAPSPKATPSRKTPERSPAPQLVSPAVGWSSAMRLGRLLSRRLTSPGTGQQATVATSSSSSSARKLLQTPPILKRARSMATGAEVDGFTPHSILRSRLRATLAASEVPPASLLHRSRISFSLVDKAPPATDVAAPADDQQKPSTSAAASRASFPVPAPGLERVSHLALSSSRISSADVGDRNTRLLGDITSRPSILDRISSSHFRFSTTLGDQGRGSFGTSENGLSASTLQREEPVMERHSPQERLHEPEKSEEEEDDEEEAGHGQHSVVQEAAAGSRDEHAGDRSPATPEFSTAIAPEDKSLAEYEDTSGTVAETSSINAPEDSIILELEDSDDLNVNAPESSVDEPTEEYMSAEEPMDLTSYDDDVPISNGPQKDALAMVEIEAEVPQSTVATDPENLVSALTNEEGDSPDDSSNDANSTVDLSKLCYVSSEDEEDEEEDNEDDEEDNEDDEDEKSEQENEEESEEEEESEQDDDDSEITFKPCHREAILAISKSAPTQAVSSAGHGNRSHAVEVLEVREEAIDLALPAAAVVEEEEVEPLTGPEPVSNMASFPVEVRVEDAQKVEVDVPEMDKERQETLPDIADTSETNSTCDIKAPQVKEVAAEESKEKEEAVTTNTSVSEACEGEEFDDDDDDADLALPDLEESTSSVEVSLKKQSNTRAKNKSNYTQVKDKQTPTRRSANKTSTAKRVSGAKDYSEQSSLSGDNQGSVRTSLRRKGRSVTAANEREGHVDSTAAYDSVPAIAEQPEALTLTKTSETDFGPDLAASDVPRKRRSRRLLQASLVESVEDHPTTETPVTPSRALRRGRRSNLRPLPEVLAETLADDATKPEVQPATPLGSASATHFESKRALRSANKSSRTLPAISPVPENADGGETVPKPETIEATAAPRRGRKSAKAADVSLGVADTPAAPGTVSREPFEFSPPIRRSTRCIEKATLLDKSQIELPERPTVVDYGFSSPNTRMRQYKKLRTPEKQPHVDVATEEIVEMKMPPMEDNEPIPVQEATVRQRLPRKAKKAKRKTEWVPPEIELNLISPPVTPAFPKSSLRKRGLQETEPPLQSAEETSTARTGLRRYTRNAFGRSRSRVKL
ncbi:protein ELYS isoform X1 [Lampetra fluviatilis]